MKAYKYKNLHFISFPMLLSTNVYVHEGFEELILIDTGLSFSANSLIKYIKKLGKPLSSIVLTHAHDDHIGGLEKIHSAFSNSKIYIGANEVKLFEAQLKKFPSKLSYETLSDGDKLGQLEVIETPGHTSGSISLYDNDYRHLICGDLMHSQGGLTISGDIRPLFPFPSLATESLATSIASMEKLREYKLDFVFYGHGDMTMNFDEKIDSLIERAKKKL